MQTEFGNYKVTDHRGKEAPSESCRVCGAPIPHSKTYGTPTMECIKYLRGDALALLREAHRFLNAQAFTEEEMDDFCRRLDVYFGIPSDKSS